MTAGNPNWPLSRSRPLRWAASAALLVALATTTGCRDYLDRKDTVYLGGGNAVAENKVAQTIDPWPPGSFKKHQSTNGQRAAKAIERYVKNEDKVKSIKEDATTE